MGKEKAGFLTPKAIGNRIKAKGLQKLRWYCQMCQKQCRDENGFKCHTMSESHMRQMEMFSQDSGRFMDEFSREFETGMLEIIKRKARSQRQNANQMYRDFIADKQHFHMNATVWETLTDFVMYLGRTGKCEVDETEKGWFVTYIDRDPETLARLDAHAKRERSELDSEEKHQRDIQRQVKAARRVADGDPDEAPTELKRDDVAGKIALGGIGASTLGSGKAKLVQPPASVFGMADAEDAHPAIGTGGASGRASGAGGSSMSHGLGLGGSGFGGGGFGGVKKPSAMETIMLENKAREERAAAKAAAANAAAAAAATAASSSGKADSWLGEGLVVKVINKHLADGRYYKKKGVVEQVMERYNAHVRMNESGDLLRLGEDDLETVIPAVGGRVRVLNGRGRGAAATLIAIDEARFCVQVEVEAGHRLAHGTVLERLEYEDVCKLANV